MPMHPLNDFRRRGPPNALHRACYVGMEKAILSPHGDMKEKLGAMGIDIDQGDPDALTALMLSAHNGNLYAVRILLDNGANFEIVAYHGLTALQLAAERGVCVCVCVCVCSSGEPSRRAQATIYTTVF